MWTNELQDKPVMSIAEGTTLGSVRDVLLDDTYLQVAALVIGGGGLLGGRRKAVAYSAVRGIGPDAVMVSGQEAVQEVTDASSWGTAHRGEEMRQEVMSESGVRLGQVAAVEFDPQTGAVTALQFARDGATPPDGMDESVISRAQIVRLTAKLAVVQHAVLEQNAAAADASRAPASGQVVGQEPTGTPGRAVDQPAADRSGERAGPTDPDGFLSPGEQAVNERIGPEPSLPVAGAVRN